MRDRGPPAGPAHAGPLAAAVILADGDAGPESDEPRAFVRVLGRSLLELCVDTLDACPGIHGFVVIAPAGMEDRAAEAARTSAKFLAAVPGRRTSRESVAAGVEVLPPRFEVVVCHDVARPLASPELFAAVLRALDGADAAVPELPVGDTVKRVDAGVVRETIPRAGLGVVQTPQGFRREALVAAYRAQLGNPGRPTDDTSLLAPAGFRVATLPGDPANLKLRTPGDLRLVERLMAERLSPGHGR